MPVMPFGMLPDNTLKSRASSVRAVNNDSDDGRVPTRFSSVRVNDLRNTTTLVRSMHAATEPDDTQRPDSHDVC
jgi:hypothetical protein